MISKIGSGNVYEDLYRKMHGIFEYWQAPVDDMDQMSNLKDAIGVASQGLGGQIFSDYFMQALTGEDTLAGFTTIVADSFAPDQQIVQLVEDEEWMTFWLLYFADHAGHAEYAGTVVGLLYKEKREADALTLLKKAYTGSDWDT